MAEVLDEHRFHLGHQVNRSPLTLSGLDKWEKSRDLNINNIKGVLLCIVCKNPHCPEDAVKSGPPIILMWCKHALVMQLKSFPIRTVEKEKGVHSV